MSIPSIVTLGFGSFGSVADVVTLGFGAGEAVIEEPPEFFPGAAAGGGASTSSRGYSSTQHLRPFAEEYEEEEEGAGEDATPLVIPAECFAARTGRVCLRSSTAAVGRGEASATTASPARLSISVFAAEATGEAASRTRKPGRFSLRKEAQRVRIEDALETTLVTQGVDAYVAAELFWERMQP